MDDTVRYQREQTIGGSGGQAGQVLALPLFADIADATARAN